MTFDATTYIDWSPHFWQGSISFTGAPSCAGQGYSDGNGRMLTPGVTYDFSVTATLVVGATGPNFGRFQFGEGVASTAPCGVPYYGPNNVEETIGPFPEGETHTGSFEVGPSGSADFMYAFMGADHDGGATPFGHGEFWVDPPGWVPTPRPTPNAGDCVINDTTTVPPDGSTTNFGLVLGSVVRYCSGSLKVYVNGVQVPITELSPAAGTFAFVAQPAALAVITASYRAWVDGSSC